MAHDLSLLKPEIALLLGVVATLACEMLRAPRLALLATLAALLVATGLSVPLVGVHASVFGGTFRVGPLSVWAKLLLLPATALAALLARAELGGSDREGSVYALMGLTAFGALVLAGAGDSMLLVLGVVLAGLGSFALVAYPRDDAATEAAMKFFVFGSVSGAVMTFGLSYWFGATGTTLLSGLGALRAAPLAAALGLAAVLLGLGYEATLAPFHFWAPDAYDGAPVSVAGFLSVVPKLGALFALAQVTGALPDPGVWRAALAALAALSMVWGTLGALAQHNVVRLLAYSSIAQAGYFLLAVQALPDPLALQALVLFAAAYAAMNLGAFAVVVRVTRPSGDRSLASFEGLGRRAAPAGVAMVLFLLSLTGIPPLAGFAGKALLFGAAIHAGALWLAVVGILASVVSLAVYLRIIVPMYRDPRTDAGSEPAPDGSEPVGVGTAAPPDSASWPAVAVWLVAAAVTLALGVAGQIVLSALSG